MGVYIKGMKMPESCEMCPIEGCEYINGKFTCPLVEIDDEAIDIAQELKRAILMGYLYAKKDVVRCKE